MTACSTSVSSLSSDFSYGQFGTTISAQKHIDAPFFSQKQYYCGPAALSTVLNYYGVTVSPEELAKQIFIPEKKGSLQVEVKAASRRAEFLPYELSGGFQNLLAEVNADHPVLVLQNLGLSWFPKWHYAVVVGYELNSKTMILHSGTHENYRLSFRTFLATWQRADNWALVIVPTHIMPVSAEEKTYLRTATDLENTGHLSAAVEAYQQALLKWPENEIALLGAGNYYYTQQAFPESTQMFLKLVQAHPESAAGWNNFAYALQKSQCSSLAEIAIEKAINLADDKKPYLDSRLELNQIASQQKENRDFCESIKF